MDNENEKTNPGSGRATARKVIPFREPAHTFYGVFEYCSEELTLALLANPLTEEGV